MLTGMLDFALRKAFHLRWRYLCRKKLALNDRNRGANRKARRFDAAGTAVFEGREGNTLRFSAADGAAIGVSVLGERLFRVTFHPRGAPWPDRTWLVAGRDGDVPREGRDRDDYSPFDIPPFTHQATGQTVTVRTGGLVVEASLDPFRITWKDPAGKEIARDAPEGAHSIDRAGGAVRHVMTIGPADHYYGFGERPGPLDRRGRSMFMMDVDVMGYDARRQDPMYKHFPFYITLDGSSGACHGIFYDNLSFTEFDMGLGDPARRVYTADDGDIDCYFMFGPTMGEVVRHLVRLTGPMVLPPRWSLGYLGSTMTYTEKENAQEELGRFVDLCGEHRIPCDLFHLSSGYTTGDDGKRYVFNWNTSRIPDPRAMVGRFRRGGIRLTGNIKPCLLTTHPRYDEVAAMRGFVEEAERDAPHVTPFWGGAGSYLDFTNPGTYDWWKTSVAGHVLAYGIDSTWNDNNEYEIWNGACRCRGFGRETEIAHLRPVMTLLMNKASYEAQREAAPGKRPYLISRSGCPGLQRYAQTWTGDNYTSWESLKYNVPMGLGLSLSGMFNVGHDVGGFFGFRPGPELFVRWVENGIFHPRFTIHSWHVDKSVNEPWMYPDMLPLVRGAIEFRYRLIPFLYSLVFAAAAGSSPVIRPMAWSFPGDARSRTESFDFMLGDHLLVASVFENGARTRRVYLPGDVEWVDFHRGEYHRGGAEASVPAPLEYNPLLVRAGGIIPTGNAVRPGEAGSEYREIRCFPHRGRGRGSFTLIEDDGESMDYKRGIYTEVLLDVSSDETTITVSAVPKGAYGLPYREMDFLFPRGETRDIQSASKIVRRWDDGRGPAVRIAL